MNRRHGMNRITASGRPEALILCLLFILFILSKPFLLP